MAGGRPRTYNTAEGLQKAVDDYFVYIQGEFHIEKKKVFNKEAGKMLMQDVKIWDRLPEPATVTGMALSLGFESRQSIYDYEKDGEFSYIIKNARLKVECEYEKNLTTAASPTGSIFALKNMGWKDKQETEHSGSLGIVWNEQKTYSDSAQK